MKNKKGFTLIELLAVIVILAIIALIATPAIINVIDNARKKAFEDTSYGVLEGLRLDYTERIMTNTTSMEKTFTFPNSGLKLSGEEPAYGTAKIDSKGNISFALVDKDKRWCAKKESNSEEVTIEDYNEENCKIDGTSGGETLNCDGKVPNSFATDSWETIACAVKNEELDKYKVGDEKEVTLTGEYSGTYTVRIANTSTPTECSGANFSQSACGFVVEFKDIITNAQMNSTQTSKGGWPGSELYKKLNPSESGNTSESIIYNSLPEELKNVIMETKVVSGHGSSDTTNFTSIDKLYLLSTKEVWGKYNNYIFESSEKETRQLDYYSNIGVTVHNYSGTIKQYNGENSNWRLRSPYSSMHSDFYFVYLNGGYYSNVAESSYGIAPAFRIG